MPFALTPASGQATRPPDPVDVAAIDFIVDTAIWSVTRGVGENSHVVTLRIIEAPNVEPVVTWNPATATVAAFVSPQVWQFTNANKTATLTSVA